MPAPAWDTISTDITCPLCEYNLRGLIEPRCPECGHRFDWDEVSNRNNTQHPFLFEHGRSHLLWRGWRTGVSSLMPMRFWKTVRPTMRINIRRLVIYWLMYTVPVLLGICAYVGIAAYRLELRLLSYGLRRPLAWSDCLLMQLRRDWVIYGTALFLLVWPWITLLALRMFWVTLQRSEIRRGHPVRVVVYSGDIAWALALFVVGLAFFENPYMYQSQYFSFMYRMLKSLGLLGHEITMFKAAMVMQVILTYRISVASKKYLATPQPVIMAIITQLVSMLLFLILVSRLADR